MRRRHLLAAPLLAAPGLRAQPAWPTRPLRMLVPFPPGGTTDVLARLVAAHMERTLGQPVVLENRPGAAGNLAVDAVAKAAPDGYTIGVGTPSNMAINPVLMPNMPYDALRDIAALSLLALVPNVVMVNNDVPARTLAEFIAWARARPGQAFGHPGAGTTQQLSGTLLALAAGIELQHVPFRGGAPALIELIAGRIPVVVDSIAGPIGAIREGRVRALAVTSRERMPQLPEVPAVSETFPGFEALSWVGFIAPARVPELILDRVSAAAQAAARDPEIRRRIEESVSIPVGGDRAGFASFIRSEMERWTPAIRASGIRPE
ncbi:MAG TPA: tripartite tricarboxylate transporter substrate binding protein [Acetobacteraceae bacterium]|nr:tripartite tricarboxylate transporter substrate binding protein [Acetobacteraceae bacterium]